MKDHIWMAVHAFGRGRRGGVINSHNLHACIMFQFQRKGEAKGSGDIQNRGEDVARGQVSLLELKMGIWGEEV